MQAVLRTLLSLLECYAFDLLGCPVLAIFKRPEIEVVRRRR